MTPRNIIIIGGGGGSSALIKTLKHSVYNKYLGRQHILVKKHIVQKQHQIKLSEVQLDSIIKRC